MNTGEKLKQSYLKSLIEDSEAEDKLLLADYELHVISPDIWTEKQVLQSLNRLMLTERAIANIEL